MGARCRSDYFRQSQKVGASLVSLFLSVLVAEAAVRAASARWAHVLDIEMWRYARTVKRISASPDVVEEHVPDADETLMGVRIRTDDLGFRLPSSEIERRRTWNDRIAIVLGDSFTLGWGVPEGQTYSDRLESTARQEADASGRTAIQFRNAGIGNSNTLMQVARLEPLLRRPGASWVVVGFFLNDAEECPRPDPRWLARASALFTLGSGALARGAKGLRSDYRHYYLDLYAPGRPGFAAMREALNRLGRISSETGTPVTLLQLPEMHEPYGFGPFRTVYDDVAAVARASGLEVIDASSGFRPGRGEEYWVDGGDPHPNSRAHELFARALGGSRVLDGFLAPARAGGQARVPSLKRETTSPEVRRKGQGAALPDPGRPS